MRWCVDVCSVIISMWCIMGGTRVCCILGLCMVSIREQIMRRFFFQEGGGFMVLMWKPYKR